MRIETLFLLALTLASCTKTSAREQPDTRVVRYAAGDDREPALIEVRGVQIAITAPVSNALSVESQSTATRIMIAMDSLTPPPAPGEDPACRFWLRGRPIVVREGHLYIGARDYGAVTKSDAVAVDAKGVHVRGELRGELEK